MVVSVEEGLDLIYQHVSAKALECIAIENAINRVIAQDVTATHNLPPFDNSAMDGYAITNRDVGKDTKVQHTIFAGDIEDQKISSGHCMKIMTGAKIPTGCDAVVPQEDTTEGKHGVILPREIREAQHIRRCGEDIISGELLLTAGTRLHAHQITLLASQGISHIHVHQKPKVAVFASGSELKMYHETLESHQLYNTNSPTFYARAEELGCDVRFIGTAMDSLKSIEEHILASRDADLIITSGGVSVGDADFTKEAFNAFGFEVLFDKVAIKPGKPTTFGHINESFVINLPGNPLAASMNFELFAQSIILALSGDREKYLKPLHVKMSEDYKIKPGRRTLIPGLYDGRCFTPAEKFAPGMVSPLAKCNGWIMLDERVNELKQDAIVKMISTQFSFTCKDQESLISL
ncbi:MAG: gephyrin-like molybdotransferase Glp [Campylobacterota bacterium]|nr:gephyrin-like molybdotransferase Glp [Campylobacterota bacterium]